MPRCINNQELDSLIEHNSDDTIVGAAARELKLARKALAKASKDEEEVQRLSDKLATGMAQLEAQQNTKH